MSGHNESVVNLGAHASRLGSARANSIYVDIVLRFLMVVVVSGIFIWLNHGVLDIVAEVMKSDKEMLVARQITASDRLITSNVIMALVGATVVQTGIGFIAICTYLFSKRAAETVADTDE